jgi:hypothetical protein
MFNTQDQDAPPSGCGCSSHDTSVGRDNTARRRTATSDDEWFHVCYSEVVKHFLNTNVTHLSSAIASNTTISTASLVPQGASHYHLLRLTEMIDLLFSTGNGVDGRVRVKGSQAALGGVVKELRQTLVYKLVEKNVSQAPEIATILLLASVSKDSFLYKMLETAPHLRQALTSKDITDTITSLSPRLKKELAKVQDTCNLLRPAV